MARSFNESDLSSSLFADDGADPMSGISNLADAMLVLACGLMMSLVVYWGLDLPSYTSLEDEGMVEVATADALPEETDLDGTGSGGYQELGSAYLDPATGKVYIQTNEG